MGKKGALSKLKSAMSTFGPSGGGDDDLRFLLTEDILLFGIP
jgi:hypothetical protein